MSRVLFALVTPPLLYLLQPKVCARYGALSIPQSLPPVRHITRIQCWPLADKVDQDWPTNCNCANRYSYAAMPQLPRKELYTTSKPHSAY